MQFRYEGQLFAGSLFDGIERRKNSEDREIGGEKPEFAFPRTILKFLRCFCAQDVAGKIRDTAFKILMEHFWRALKLSTL